MSFDGTNATAKRDVIRGLVFTPGAKDDVEPRYRGSGVVMQRRKTYRVRVAVPENEQLHPFLAPATLRAIGVPDGPLGVEAQHAVDCRPSDAMPLSLVRALGSLAHPGLAQGVGRWPLLEPSSGAAQTLKGISQFPT